MTLNKQNVCVFIENEAQLQQAKELLEKYGEKICERVFYLSNNNEDFLQLFLLSKEWGLSYISNEIQITLSELETILKNDTL